MQQPTAYNDDDIKTLDWMEHIRRRPGMYIGKLGDGSYADDGIYVLLKEDYTVLNAKAAYRFGTRDKGLNLFVKGENLTATRYSINEGFPMPKAIFMGGIDVTF